VHHVPPDEVELVDADDLPETLLFRGHGLDHRLVVALVPEAVLPLMSRMVLRVTLVLFTRGVLCGSSY
jgi:hypothetical protein